MTRVSLPIGIRGFIDPALGALAIVVILIFGALWLYRDSLPFQDEVTIYQAFCPGGRANEICKSKEETANPETYKALVDQQLVIYWFDSGAPKRYDKCAVRDARNWTCIFADQDSLYSDDRKEMVDGEVREFRTISVPSPFYQVPKWYWWRLKLTGKQ